MLNRYTRFDKRKKRGNIIGIRSNFYKKCLKNVLDDFQSSIYCCKWFIINSYLEFNNVKFLERFFECNTKRFCKGQ